MHSLKVVTFFILVSFAVGDKEEATSPVELEGEPAADFAHESILGITHFYFNFDLHFPFTMFEFF